MNLLTATVTEIEFGPLPLNAALPAPPPGPPFPVPSNFVVFTKQSGQVTPGHLVAWATDEIVVDAGVQFNNAYGKFVSSNIVNFNSANTDTGISINLPVGYVRYRVEQIVINAATAAINAATCGVFSGQGAGGTVVIPGGTAITVSQVANDTSNNMQVLTPPGANNIAFADPSLFFRVQAAQGSPATAQVSIFYQPLP